MLRLYCGSAAAHPKKISLRLNPDCLFAKPHPQVHHLRFTMTSTCPSWWDCVFGPLKFVHFQSPGAEFLDREIPARSAPVFGWRLEHFHQRRDGSEIGSIARAPMSDGAASGERRCIA